MKSLCLSVTNRKPKFSTYLRKERNSKKTNKPRFTNFGQTGIGWKSCGEDVKINVKHVRYTVFLLTQPSSQTRTSTLSLRSPTAKL